LTRVRWTAVARRLPYLALVLAAAAGCTRHFFRERADRDVEDLLTEKSIDPRWDVRTRNWYVYPDPRARFADFDKPDHPKKPPDDPATAALSPDPQPLRSKFCSGSDQEGTGYLEFLRYCDQHNRNQRLRPFASEDGKPAAKLGSPYQPVIATNTSEAAESRRRIEHTLHTDETGFLITLVEAVELAQFNSRDLQDRREDLYTAALPVTFQRFQFVPQVFAGVTATRTWLGSQVPGGPGSNWNVATTGSVTQLFPTGATVVAQLANQLVIDLGTNAPHVGISNFTLSITQPLLRGGGWAVTLEPLTQAERTLVYAVRSYARFRENFYVYIVGGADVFNAPYSYAGLALRGVTPSLTAPSQGYLPTLLTAALERDERENLASLTVDFALYREYQGRGDVSELQVGQVEQQILSSQTRLLNQQQLLASGLDQFKLQLGLPTKLSLELDEAPTRPMRDMLGEFGRARDEYNALREEADRFRARFRVPLLFLAGPAAGPIAFEIPLRDEIRALVLNSAMTRSTKQFKAGIEARWERWRTMPPDALKAELRRMAEEIRTLEVRQAALEARNDKLPPAEEARLRDLPRDSAIGQLEQALRAYENLRLAKERTARNESLFYEEAVNAFMRVMNEARMERRAEIRAAWPALPAATVEGTDLVTSDLDRAETVATQVALANRLELMTARAQVVDAWRNIAVQANSLLGVANVGYNFNSPSTPNANEPFALGGSRSTHQLVLTGELPLVRRAERNAYRTALINYQRARRNLQATEDFILNDVRTDLRSLRVLAENYRIQQRAVEVAYDQVENSLDVLQAPPQPDVPVVGQAPQPGSAAAQTQQAAANAAALTQQLLGAQSSLLAAQNGLYTTWVNYLIARMTLYRDIERLPLDLRGVWIDESYPSPTQQPDVLPAPRPVADAGDPAESERFADRRAPRTP
jgi:outer membrane protein TolC